MGQAIKATFAALRVLVFLALEFLALVLLLDFAPATAQEFPNQPVKALNPMGAGGSSDVVMRALAEELQRRWGQPVVVENRPGGGTTIGARACAQAPKDGHTICIFPAETVTYIPHTMKNPGYDADKDFVPITLAFFNPQVLVANASLNVRSLAELAALSKAKPGTLSFFSASTALQVWMERWKKATGVDIVWVASKSGSEAVNGVIAGSTPVAFYGAANFLQYIETGAVKPLAVDGERRAPQLPEVPSLAELGFKDRLPRIWFGLFAPGGTPKPIIDRLYREIIAVATPEFRKRRLLDLTLEPVFNTPEEFAAFLKDDRALSELVVTEAGLKVN